MNTWNKKVKVGGKSVPKSQVRAYYKKMWKNPNFRRNVTQKGVYIRADYNGHTVIRRKGIRIKNWNDMERLIKGHAVEFISPVNKMGYKTGIDVDIPKSKLRSKATVRKKVLHQLRKDKVNIRLVTDAPHGVHVFSNSSKSRIKSSLRKVGRGYHVGRHAKNKIVLDPYEVAVAIPNSLSTRCKPYKVLK
jgi:hypothetical protein